ncbi:MAG: hypothetical protein WBP41_19570 [Saprospiraceae bacterium]
MVNLTKDQKTLIVNEYNDLRSTDQYKISGKAQLFALNKVNIYAHSILSDDQKILYASAWKDQTLSLIHSYYHYLNLTEVQKEKIIATMESVPGFDSLQIINYFPDIPKDTMFSLLDSTQLAAEAGQQKQIKRNFENAMAAADSGRLQDATFEKTRVRFILKYYAKHLRNEHKSILHKLQYINIEDAKRIAVISNLYQKRVKSDRIQEIRKCYTSDSLLIAPINKQLIEYSYERFALQPNLCVYWCRFGASRTPEIKDEEEQILSVLESIKLTYPDIVNDSILRLKKHKTKLKNKIEHVRPSRKTGTVVNIIADKRIEALDDIAELILIQ